MNDNKRVLIAYRLSQAKESINEAKVLFNEGMSFRSVMNRLYYAMFYSLLALFQEKGISTSKHTGVISNFNKEFIKTGIFEKELSKTIHRAFELRQKADYMENVVISEEEVAVMFKKSEFFIKSIKDFLAE